ncbi:hypothetical protein [Gynuella sunshinyii]|uniref:Uncharacterized protein n=1 Tax=Gynuella sunshinyii YC6258 TaxID=1445510 RepID=A0A0C5VFN8_9GAMM|nr:hypothetical protein [Gynuella sunshinyii]AJQ93382.1 hypothetical Protein YC6258_01334 [Gynuella sunshinyii YC6258]
MAFQFSVFFVRGCDEKAIAVYEDVACIKSFDKPFSGIGISIPKFTSKDPELDELLALSKTLGLDESGDWAFMIYECFGGSIDYLYGYQNRKGAIYGPITEPSLEKVEDTYVEFMHNFGVGKNKALKFEPFERGYFDA